VLCWQPDAGTTINNQILIEVSKCVEKQANASEFPQHFLGASLQEQPDKFYMALSKKRLIVEAESSMQTIMENLQSYRIKFALNCEGFQYRLGDFRVRVGKVVPMNSENLRGIVMEMEYLPIYSCKTSHLIMSEFFEILKETLGKKSLPGHFVHAEQNFSEFGLSDQYTSWHTVVQYASILAQMSTTMVLKKEDGKIPFASISPCSKMHKNFPQHFLGASLQEQPDKFYMALSRKRRIVEAESSMQTIMANLQSYRIKFALNCENLRGIVMEMEYLPISSWKTSHLIMSEFFKILKETLGKKSLPGHFVHAEQNFSEFGLFDQYTSRHTVVQYSSILAQMSTTAQ
uniref:Mediator of RNA polymerase II transcription subunit 20 n=1 Tax=Solanum lycopersicum TaxID=4081 RepID=A0A3Q7IIE4_SOLLC